MSLLADKVVLVTGASRGIGAEAARLFAAEGAHVVLGARNRERLAEVAAGVDGAVAVPGDLSTAAGVDHLVDAALRRHGRIDGAYLNAAVGHAHAGTLADLTEDQWDEVHATGLKGVWLALRALVPHLAGRGGSVVVAGSVAGLTGGIGDAGYQAAKHGVVGLTRAAVAEFSPVGVRVNVVAPGAILTEKVRQDFAAMPHARAAFEQHTPMRRPGAPAEVAEAAAWLLSDRSSYVTGAVLPVDGGLTATRL
ncbi:SDR family NAD(P)-dependent oxidoreductase [Actinosynnema sp. NPDC051121]